MEHLDCLHYMPRGRPQWLPHVERNLRGADNFSILLRMAAVDVSICAQDLEAASVGHGLRAVQALVVRFWTHLWHVLLSALYSRLTARAKTHTQAHDRHRICLQNSDHGAQLRSSNCRQPSVVGPKKDMSRATPAWIPQPRAVHMGRRVLNTSSIEEHRRHTATIEQAHSWADAAGLPSMISEGELDLAQISATARHVMFRLHCMYSGRVLDVVVSMDQVHPRNAPRTAPPFQPF